VDGNPDAIKAMLDSKAETDHMTDGYMMGIGSHIPWNVPPKAAKLNLDYASEVACRA